MSVVAANNWIVMMHVLIHVCVVFEFISCPASKYHASYYYIGSILWPESWNMFRLTISLTVLVGCLAGKGEFRRFALSNKSQTHCQSQLYKSVNIMSDHNCTNILISNTQNYIPKVSNFSAVEKTFMEMSSWWKDKKLNTEKIEIMEQIYWD